MFVLFKRLNIKQESIPVGCIPPALVVTGVGEGCAAYHGCVLPIRGGVCVAYVAHYGVGSVLPTMGLCCLLGGVLPTTGDAL